MTKLVDQHRIAYTFPYIDLAPESANFVKCTSQFFDNS